MKKRLIVIVVLLPLIALGQSTTAELDEYRKAANKGDANAEYQVGLIFHEGRGIAKDKKKAYKWFNRAAKSGDADGQYYVGLVYSLGQGTKKDPQKADKWIRLAADQGNARALAYFKNKEAIAAEAEDDSILRSNQTEDRYENEVHIIYRKGTDTRFTGITRDRNEQGQVSNEVQYVDGIKHGTDTRWAGGRKHTENHYVNGKQHGLSSAWKYSNGQKWFEGNYVDGKREGNHTWWYEDGTKSAEDNYINGVKQGLYTTWHPNGQKSYEVNKVDGKPVGMKTKWHENGRKSSETESLGEQLGTRQVYWHDNGHKKSEGTSKDGYRQGLWTEYYENGQKKSDEMRLLQTRPDLGYAGNRARVYWTEWYDTGQKKTEGLYVGYRPPYMRDRNGNPFKNRRYGRWVDWDSDGNEKVTCHSGDCVVYPAYVCHSSTESPGHTRLLEVLYSDVPDHVAHGDHVGFDGKCFAVVEADPGIGFDQAEAACVDDFAGHLASIHSRAEDHFISAILDPGGKGKITALIGAYSPDGFMLGPRGSYHWSDGSIWNYGTWRTKTGEPNKSPANAPAVVQFWPNTNGDLSGWNDVDKRDLMPRYVCKYEPK